MKMFYMFTVLIICLRTKYGLPQSPIIKSRCVTNGLNIPSANTNGLIKDFLFPCV